MLLLHFSTKRLFLSEVTKLIADIDPLTAQNSGGDDPSSVIDRNYNTNVDTEPGSDGRSWLKIGLGKVYCVHRIIWYRQNNELHLGWTCTQNECPCTDGGFCDRFTLTVSSVGTMPGGLLNGSNCKYGDTVMLEKTTGDEFGIYEMTFKGYLAGQCVAHSLLGSQIFIDITS